WRPAGFVNVPGFSTPCRARHLDELAAFNRRRALKRRWGWTGQTAVFIQVRSHQAHGAGFLHPAGGAPRSATSENRQQSKFAAFAVTIQNKRAAFNCVKPGGLDGCTADVFLVGPAVHELLAAC